jgi:ribosome-associated protein
VIGNQCPVPIRPRATRPSDQRRGGNKLQSLELAKKIVNAIADKKGSDIVLLDLRSISLLADYFVICSGESERQVKAIVDEVTKKIKEEGVGPLQIEGDSSSGWVLMDYGDVIVHVFAPAVRSYYQLEELWSDALVVVRMQ